MTSNRTCLSFVPALLPNQTLYSWGAMFHEMSGNSTIDESLMQTFGLMRKGLHFHIPSHLDTLCASTQLALGTAEAIAQTATTLPFYTKFRSPNVAARIMKAARGNSSHGVAQTLGMVKTSIYAHPPRRSCYQCVQADIDTFGFAYWRRDHQLPGCLVCQKHGTPLLSQQHDHDSIHNKAFIWPDEGWSLIDASACPNWPSATLAMLQRLAKLAVDMARGNLAGGYSMQKMQNACLSILSERKLIAQEESLMVYEALQDYRNHFNSVVDVPEIAVAVQSSIRPLLYAIKLVDRRIHPLEWMLIIDWLFDDWATFEKRYR